MLIDFHIHAFPDNVAAKAISGLKDTLKNIGTVRKIPSTDGTIKNTVDLLKQYADLGVLMPIATRIGQQSKVNDWAAAQQQNRIISFGSVFPFDSDWEGELTHISDLNLRGIKLHPDYQGFDVDDKQIYPLYEQISAMKLPVLFHAGVDPVSLDHIHCHPKALRKVAEDFPNMKIIAAHFGGNRMYKEASEYILSSGLDNIFADTSISYFYTTKKDMINGIRSIGAERVLFATDMPWSLYDRSIKSIECLGLDSNELDMIFYKNALNLLNITENDL